MISSFSSQFSLSEDDAVQALHSSFDWDARRAKAVRDKAAALVETIRAQKRNPGQLEAFMQDYALDTEEGLALMTLAEALLRIPDKATANALIRDKVAAANWLESLGGKQDWVTKAAGVGLFVSRKTLDGVLNKVGEPVIREAMVQAMRILGKQFVLGVDIEDAIQNAHALKKQGYRMSYDMLGEGARTAADAERYFESYINAIEYVGERSGNKDALRPGISVKLSALHPRYEYAQKERCVTEMAARLLQLSQMAAHYNLALTVDAEESERLDLSLEIITGVMKDISDEGWDGFGLAVQAYHKAAPGVIDFMADIAREQSKRIQLRLVKGAYWDSEIKKAQVEGLKDFPVYTRKCHTDSSYLACVSRIFEHGDVLYPMLGTHNAHSAAAVMEIAKAYKHGWEFQRLFGMGQGLFDELVGREGVRASVYAPVGPHKELLPYLVRRLLENGANSSFVNQMLDLDASVDVLVDDPVDKSKMCSESKHPKISLPQDIFKDEPPQGRSNSAGLDLDAPGEVEPLLQEIARYNKPYMAVPIVDGHLQKHSVSQELFSPAHLEDRLGLVYAADHKIVNMAFEAGAQGFVEWNSTDAETRAAALETAADALEARRSEVMALLVREAGKTLPDALSEIREAVDFLRYYASQGRGVFASEGSALPGPTGESNRLILQGRGVFVCISPWNFPLAIFVGQIAAALMAGNAVLAKPAEQTPLIAALMVQIFHDSGIPAAALGLLPGDGRVGAMLVQHKDVAGVAFTGSTAVAREINKTLAAKDGPIVPLIAETGGQNAMIVDSSALPEQVIDDVILSAFGSSGQRCSALRALCVQDDVADKIIRMLRGAMKELNVGEPGALSSDLGPVIDEEAYAMLAAHRKALHGFAKLIYEVPLDAELARQGHYFAPCACEIPDMKGLDKEVFGPILHVIRYEKAKLDELLDDIAQTGYGLTLGIHSRIEQFYEYVAAKIPAGNVYVNRSMIGAVVGSQPFGGMGLSGTGPKAGGPHYLARFATERMVSIDTTAAGGNASLVSLSE